MIISHKIKFFNSNHCTEPITVNIILSSGNTFVAGNDVSIQCEVHGYPKPLVRWTKDGVEIQESERIRISGKWKQIQKKLCKRDE